uniref:Uncharacterized protein n=1 Tax=Arundo donax TaxID=35708 RepID=A0A0A9G086_ARUDO
MLKETLRVMLLHLAQPMTSERKEEAHILYKTVAAHRLCILVQATSTTSVWCQRVLVLNVAYSKL